MKLQVSFDLSDLQKALEVAKAIEPYVDNFELGAVLLYANGVSALQAFHEQFEPKVIVADTKIVDRGREIVDVVCHAGAQWVTVMGGTSKQVIHTTAKAAHEMNRKVMIDLLDASSIGQVALEAKNLGADAILFHQPYDEEDSLVFLDKWEMVKGNADLPIYISAKIKRNTIEEILKFNPDGIIIGKSITEAEDPAQEAKYFRDVIDGVVTE